MVGKNERPVDGRGIGKKEGKSQQNSVIDVSGGARRHAAPLLVDSNEGARILGISLSHFYKFLRKNPNAPAIMIGSLHMWRRKDLLRFIGKSCDSPPAEDILIDAQAVAALCSISRSMVYKLNDQHMIPEPLQDGRILRWSVQAIEEWVEAGCPERGKRRNRKGQSGE